MKTSSTVVLAAIASSFVLACASQKPAPAVPTPATAEHHDEGPSSQPAAPEGTSSEADHEAHEKVASAGRDHVDADGVVRRGSPLDPKMASTPVSAVVAKAKELDGKKVKLAGKVTDVCSKMGCWFAVAGDKPEDRIRISTKAHNIFVPHSAVGMTAVVEGTLTTKVIDAKTAEHLASEAASSAPKAGDVEISIDVSGLEMSKS